MKRLIVISFGVAILGNLTGCVTKGKYDSLQKELNSVQGTLGRTELELTQANSLLEDKLAELDQTRERLSQLDEAQRQMQESLQKEIADKTIKLEKLKDRLKLTMVDKILFDSGSAVIKQGGRESLKKVAESLNGVPDYRIVVEGHTDDRPMGARSRKKFDSNWELSTARSTSVVRFLQDVGEVDAVRLFAVGAAFYHPVATNETPEGRSDNRRVEIVLMPPHPEEDKASRAGSAPTEPAAVPEEGVPSEEVTPSAE